jgi:hypothetical protein
MKRVYDTGIVLRNRNFEVMRGAVVLVPPNGNGFREVICWLPPEISQNMENIKDYFIDEDGWLCYNEK